MYLGSVRSLILLLVLIVPVGLCAETTEQVGIADQETTQSIARIKNSLRADKKAGSNVIKENIADWGGDSSSEPAKASVSGMFKGLAMCLGVFFIGISIFKRMQPRTKIETASRLQVLGKVALTAKSQLILAKLDDQEVLVAVGSEQVALLQVSGKPAALYLQQQVTKSVINDQSSLTIQERSFSDPEYNA